MKDKLVLQGKLEIKNAHIVIDGIDLANVLEHESSVFMVVEPLPESKPEPAEPQGWEQRFDKEFPHCGGAFKTSLRAFIRAEIERVREKSEHEVCIARQEGYVRGLKEAREQNKHREIK